MLPYPFLEAAYMSKKCGGGNIQPLTVTENKEYNAADYGCDGFNPITVSVSSGDDGIWSAIEKKSPLVVITLSPNVLYYILEMGDVIGTHMSEGLYNNTRYVKNKGCKNLLVGVIKINGSPVYYHILSSSGTTAENDYQYLNGSLYQTFERQIKTSAINASNIYLSKSGNTYSLRATIKWYQDCLNFSQYDYPDGSHWEEKYAWSSSYSPSSAAVNMHFDNLPEVSYSDLTRGNTIEEKYSNWSSVCSDIFNAPIGVLSYTAGEEHFGEELYINDDAKNRGYYNSNVAYMEKWGKPELWE